MSGQHLASISDTATDTLATSPETFQAVGFKLLGKVSLAAFFARGNREIISLFFFFFLFSEIVITLFSFCLAFDQVI